MNILLVTGLSFAHMCVTANLTWQAARAEGVHSSALGTICDAAEQHPTQVSAKSDAEQDSMTIELADRRLVICRKDWLKLGRGQAKLVLNRAQLVSLC